jgi:hypothetical protein
MPVKPKFSGVFGCLQGNSLPQVGNNLPLRQLLPLAIQDGICPRKYNALEQAGQDQRGPACGAWCVGAHGLHRSAAWINVLYWERQHSDIGVPGAEDVQRKETNMAKVVADA